MSLSNLDKNNSVSLPADFDYTLPKSLGENVSLREFRVQPTTGTTYTLGNTVAYPNVAIMYLPCQQNSYLDPHTTYLRGKFTLSYTNSAYTQYDYTRIIGSFYSLILKQEVVINGQILESINELGVLANLLINCNLNDADKKGNPMFGFANTITDATTPYSASGNLGQIIARQTLATTATSPFTPTNTTSATYTGQCEGVTIDFALPIIGMLGANSNKAFPLWACSECRYEITFDVLNNFLAMFATAGTYSSISYSASITDLEFVGNIITLSESHQRMLQSISPVINFKSNTFKQCSNYLTNQATGTNELQVSLKYSSVKSIFATCSIPQGSTLSCFEGKYGSINPNLDLLQITAGTMVYPPRGINVSARPSDAFACLQKSFNALNMSNYNSCIAKTGYYISSTAYGLCTAYVARNTSSTGALNLPSAPVAVPLNPVLYANQCYFGIDLETCTQSSRGNLINGSNFLSIQPLMRCVVGSALANANHVINMYGLIDIILQFDTMNRTVQAII